MNILSLCDGMSCGQIALEKTGIKVNKYFASEIKDIAIKATKYNFPNTMHIGDVNKISYSDGILHTECGDFKTNIDMVIFGSPCQSLARSMKKDKRIGLEDPIRSGLFYQCCRVMKEINPKYFLMENVIMDKDQQDIIDDLMGVKPIRINSSLVTAQLRDRLYWTNIPNVTIPTDKGIVLQDVIDNGYTPDKKSKCLMMCDSHGYYNGCNWTPCKRFHRWHNKSFGNMIAPSKEYYDNCVKVSNSILNGQKPSAKAYDNYIGNDFDELRYLSKYERARLQTVPEKYVDCMTEKEAADLLGDGWTIDVIAHIFKGLKNNENIQSSN